MADLDFITAFGRLLRDGRLRDAFAANPDTVAGQIHLHESYLAAWLQLDPIEVELQADVLLRKRLDLVKYFAPETCRRVGEELWREFRRFGRENWPAEGSEKIADAFQFCRQLRQKEPKAVVESEWNRLDFAVSNQRISLHWVQMAGTNMKARRGFQFFLRGTGGRWQEYFIYLGL